MFVNEQMNHGHVSRKTKNSYHVIYLMMSIACMNTNRNSVENCLKTTFHSSLKLKTFKGNPVFRRKKPRPFTFTLCGQNTNGAMKMRKLYHAATLYINVFHFKHSPNDRFFPF